MTSLTKLPALSRSSPIAPMRRLLMVSRGAPWGLWVDFLDLERADPYSGPLKTQAHCLTNCWMYRWIILKPQLRDLYILIGIQSVNIFFHTMHYNRSASSAQQILIRKFLFVFQLSNFPRATSSCLPVGIYPFSNYRFAIQSGSKISFHQAGARFIYVQWVSELVDWQSQKTVLASMNCWSWPLWETDKQNWEMRNMTVDMYDHCFKSASSRSVRRKCKALG